MDNNNNSTEKPAQTQSRQDAEPSVHPDQELVYRLKGAIDQRGRYSFRLGDMTAGFAAGKGISNSAARNTIENRFTEQLGLTPQEYLDRHYEERRGQSTEPNFNRIRQRANGQDRGR